MPLVAVEDDGNGNLIAVHSKYKRYKVNVAMMLEGSK